MTKPTKSINDNLEEKKYTIEPMELPDNFFNENEERCYLALKSIVDSGKRPSVGDVLGRSGFARNYFNKQIGQEWKKSFKSLIEVKIKAWKEHGGNEFIDISKAIDVLVAKEKMPTYKAITKQAKLQDKYFYFETSVSYPFREKLVARIEEEQRIYELEIEEKQRAYEAEIEEKFINYKEVLKAIKKSGEKPTLELFYEQLGVTTNDFKNPYNAKKDWAIKLKKEYDKVRKHWEKYGGNTKKSMKKALKSLQKKGEEPTASEVCRVANTSFGQLRKQTFPWEKQLYTIIMKANEDYFEGINNAKHDKCFEVLDEMLKVGEFPTKGTVASKAGYDDEILKKNIRPWKEKVTKAINKALEDYTKLAPLYLDVDVLIEKVISEHPIDYSRIGINFNDEDTRYSLAHVMYAEHLIGIGGGGKKADIYVKNESFTQGYSRLIDSIIMACEGKPQKTIVSGHTFPYIIKAAIWIGNRPSNTINDAKKLFKDFSQPLRRMVKSGEISHRAAYNQQNGLINLLCGMFACEIESITEDNKHMLFLQKPPQSNAFSNAAKFSQQELEYAFAFYYHLFKQLADIILNNKSLPHPIKLPAGDALVLGGNTLIVTRETKNASQAIDYTDGHVLSDEEIDALAIEKSKIQKSPLPRIKAALLSQKNITLKQLTDINTSSVHQKRLQLGRKALDAWFMCMLFFTAMNDSTQGTLEWGEDDEFELEKDERKEFCNIKPRAQYKDVRFPLPKACVKDFEEFLKLRRFVLNGHPMPYLFFLGYGENAVYSKSFKKGDRSSNISSFMKKSIDSNLPKVCSGDSRLDHSRDALQQHGLKVALNVLQNKEDTLIKNYNGETVEEMAQSISKLMESIHENVISNNPIDESEGTATGGCGAKGQEPEAIEGSPIEVKCMDQRSCIFCVHFKTFPEPEYIRKLISLQYIIENLSYTNAPSDDYYEKEMTPWLKRIDALLNHMKERESKSEEMIEQISHEVFSDGLLSPYWLLLSEFYEETGMFA